MASTPNDELLEKEYHANRINSVAWVQHSTLLCEPLAAKALSWKTAEQRYKNSLRSVWQGQRMLA